MNIFLDGCGHYNIAQMPTKWTSASGSIVSGLNTGTTYGFRGTASKTVGLFPILASGQKAFCGATRVFVIYSNPSAPSGGPTITFGVGVDGRIYAQVGGSSFKFSTFAITFGATYHIQIYSAFSYALIPGGFNGTHTFQVYVNGVVRLSDSITINLIPYSGGLDQLAYADFTVQSNDGSGGWSGDIWLTDGELLGQCPVLQFLMVADGPVTNWTPLTPGTHFSEVNMRVADDTTYNYDNVAGDIDEYQAATVPAGTVKGLQVTMRLEKDAPSTATLKAVYRNGAGTTVLGTPTYAPSQDSYAFFLDCTRKSVFTAADWTVGEINGSFWGPKRVT